MHFAHALQLVAQISVAQWSSLIVLIINNCFFFIHFSDVIQQIVDKICFNY